MNALGYDFAWNSDAVEADERPASSVSARGAPGLQCCRRTHIFSGAFTNIAVSVVHALPKGSNCRPGSLPSFPMSAQPCRAAAMKLFGIAPRIAFSLPARESEDPPRTAGPATAAANLSQRSSTPQR